MGGLVALALISWLQFFSRFYFDRKYEASLSEESPAEYEENNVVITDDHDGGEIISEESYQPDVYPYHTDRSLL